MKRFIALLLTVLAVFGLLTGCLSSLSASDIEYEPYVMDSSEDLLAPAVSADAEDDNAPANGPPADTTTTTTTTTTTVTTTTTTTTTAATTTTTTAAVNGVVRDGTYDQRDDVALYIYTFGCLPGNYITKAEARELGWTGGSVEVYAPGKCIGGSRFGNYEGQLPTASGRVYYECDIDTLGASSRGAKRLVYSNDGLIYYTDDHYETFTLHYGQE